MQQIKSLNEIAKRRGQTLAQMALSWILRDETVASVLIGASRPQQILDNLKIVDAPAFTTEELEEIEAVCRAWILDADAVLEKRIEGIVHTIF